MVLLIVQRKPLIKLTLTQHGRFYHANLINKDFQDFQSSFRNTSIKTLFSKPIELTIIIVKKWLNSTNSTVSVTLNTLYYS